MEDEVRIGGWKSLNRVKSDANKAQWMNDQYRFSILRAFKNINNIFI